MQKNIFLLLAAILVAMFSFFAWTVKVASPATKMLAVHSYTPLKGHIHQSDSGVLRVIVLSKDSVYCYSGNVTNGKFYSVNEFRKRVVAEKNKWKDSLFVSIGQSAGASYKTTIDVLDEMSINDIKRYDLGDLTAGETQLLGGSSSTDKAPGIETPKTLVSSPEAIGENEMRLDLRLKNGLLATLVDRKNNFMKDEDVNGKEKLSHLLTKALQLSTRNNEKLNVRLYATANTSFKEFEWIVKELRAHEIYKYQLITTEE